MGKVVKGIGNAIGSVAHVASPLIGMLPGGNFINAGIDAISGLSGGQKAAIGGGAALAGLGLAGGFKPQVGATSNGATATGNDFSNYLGGFLQNGGANQQQMNAALTGMLSGRPGDPTNLQNYFNAGMGSNGQANIGQSNAQFDPQQINVGFTPQNFNPTAIASFFQGGQNFNPTAINPQQVVGGFTPQAVNTQYNPLQASSNFQAPGFVNAATPNVMQGVGQQANLGSVVNPAANVTAMQQLMQNQQKMDIANLRERFGNQALGSGAQLAESQYLANALPQQALALDQITRANNEQALTQRGQDLQNFLGSRGIDVSQLGLGSQNALSQAQMANQFNQGNAQFGAGQDLQAQLANQGAGLQAAGFGQQGQALNNQFLQGSAAQQLQAMLANQSAGLQAGQLNNQFGLDAAQLLQNNQQFGANYLQNAQQLGNQFGLNAAQLGSQNNQFAANLAAQLGQMNNQFGLNAAQMAQGNQQFNINSMLQNQQLGNQFNLGMQNVGANLQGIQANAQQNALAQLFNALGNTQRLGTAQADTTVAPSLGSQLINGAGVLGGIYNAATQAQNAAPLQAPTGGIDFGAMLSALGGAAPGIQQTPTAPTMIPQLPNINPLALPQMPAGLLR